MLEERLEGVSIPADTVNHIPLLLPQEIALGQIEKPGKNLFADGSEPLEANPDNDVILERAQSAGEEMNEEDARRAEDDLEMQGKPDNLRSPISHPARETLIPQHRIQKKRHRPRLEDAHRRPQ